MKFIDIDKLIAAREKKTIPEIFSEKGEQYFRKLEREIVLEESLNNNIVIATGGGVIIDNENIKNLKETSFIVYLDCTIECIYEKPPSTASERMLHSVACTPSMVYSESGFFVSGRITFRSSA